MIVADTNLIAYLLIDGSQTSVARAVWAKDPDWHVPPLWRPEFLSVLVTSVRAGLLEEVEALRIWRVALDLLRNAEVEPNPEDVLAMALEYDLSAYDAQFLVTAVALETNLVTSDRRLLAAGNPHPLSPADFVQRD